MRTKKMPKKISDADQPWPSNYPPLEAWLNAHGITCHWQKRVTGGSYATVAEAWLVRAQPHPRVVIITVHGYKRGWDIFVAPDTNNTDETLREANERLGIVAAVEAKP